MKAESYISNKEGKKREKNDDLQYFTLGVKYRTHFLLKQL